MTTTAIAFLNARIAYIRWIVLLGGLAMVFWAGKHWSYLECQADKAEIKNAQDAAYRASVDKNQAIGLNLETGLNDYKNRVKDIPHANNDSSGVFNAQEILLINKRIEAGKKVRVQ